MSHDLQLISLRDAGFHILSSYIHRLLKTLNTPSTFLPYSSPSWTPLLWKVCACKCTLQIHFQVFVIVCLSFEISVYSRALSELPLTTLSPRPPTAPTIIVSLRVFLSHTTFSLDIRSFSVSSTALDLCPACLYFFSTRLFILPSVPPIGF